MNFVSLYDSCIRLCNFIIN